MIYVVDTHALVWYLEDSGKLSKRALAVFDNQDSHLIIPSIVLAEIRHLAAKGKTDISSDKIFEFIERDGRCLVFPLDMHVIKWLPLQLDIHDGIICATALIYKNILKEDVKLITKDAVIAGSKLIEILW